MSSNDTTTIGVHRALHEALNSAREAQHRLDDGDATPDLDELANVFSFAEAVDRRHVLVRVLRQLPDIQREVLVCRYLLDATVAETATALDIAEGTVKSAASRGLDQLRQLLYDEEKRGCRVHPR